MTGFYQASPIKRVRATKAEIEERRSGLLAIVSQMHPMTVRQVFYQASVVGLVDKSEAGYAKVQTDLVMLRKSGLLAYNALADNTRWQRRPQTFGSVEQALLDTARFYRKSLWADADSYVEVWLEKDALSGVIHPVTDLYDVPLMVARGYASLSFLHSAANYITSLQVPTYIYHLGDYDPSGVDAAQKIETTLRQMAPMAEIHFDRLAVLPPQIEAWHLPSRPTKTSDTRSGSFGDISVELDAIKPDDLRDMVEQAISRHLPPEQFQILKTAENSERELIARLVRRIGGSA